MEYEGIGLDLFPNYSLENYKVTKVEVDIGESPEDLRQRMEEERKTIIKRNNNFNEGVDLHKNLKKIDIELINDIPEGWSPFDPISDIGLLDLARSIDNVGLIYPIYVMVDKLGAYSVIIGRCRLLAYIKLFEETNNPKYKFIPSYIIDMNEVDELFLRTMVIESNIGFRSISKSNLIKSLIINYEAMKMAKEFRNEKNVAMELAKTYNMSTSSIFNFLKARDLCNEALTLLFDEKIPLKSAIYLARVPKEMQLNILRRYGIEGVKVFFRLKLLTTEGNLSIEKLDEKIKLVENITPHKTRITVELHRELVNPFLEYLNGFVKEKASRFAGLVSQGKFKYVFKVKYDEETMGLYADKNIIDKNLLKKLNSKTCAEFFK